MAEEAIYVTQEGLKSLQEEYDYLINTRRKEVAEKLREARELGDVAENAAYDAVKDEQAVVEGRIEELGGLLKRARVVVCGKDGCVAIGTKVRLRLEGDEREFQIVGATEADPMSGKISHRSPLGKALMGKKIGDRVEVEAPVGKLSYCILEIK